MLNFPEEHGLPRPVPAPPDCITTEALRAKYAAEQFWRTIKEREWTGTAGCKQGSQELPTVQLPPERCGICLPAHLRHCYNCLMSGFWSNFDVLAFLQ